MYVNTQTFNKIDAIFNYDFLLLQQKFQFVTPFANFKHQDKNYEAFRKLLIRFFKVQTSSLYRKIFGTVLISTRCQIKIEPQL